MRYLILGSGPAGIAAALAIRKTDGKSDVVIATEEYAAPYLRPHIPDVVAGEKEAAAIADPRAKELAAQRIEIRGGKRARRVDAAKNRVIFSDGGEEAYNFLLVATGGKPILPLGAMFCPGSFLPMNSLADAERIRGRAMRSESALVYGPGYLGIEAARALRKLGQKVVWINPGLPRFGNPIPGDVEAKLVERLRAQGVAVKEGADIADILDADGTSYVVRTTDGAETRCGLVVVATERLPAVGFLEGSGVKVGSGVLADEYLRTSVSNIFAAGDCAEIYDINRRESRINFGWRSAIKQGELAGTNMAGGEQLFIRNSEDYFGLLYGAPIAERVG